MITWNKTLVHISFGALPDLGLTLKWLSMPQGLFWLGKVWFHLFTIWGLWRAQLLSCRSRRFTDDGSRARIENLPQQLSESIIVLLAHTIISKACTQIISRTALWVAVLDYKKYLDYEMHKDWHGGGGGWSEPRKREIVESKRERGTQGWLSLLCNTEDWTQDEPLLWHKFICVVRCS